MFCFVALASAHEVVALWFIVYLRLCTCGNPLRFLFSIIAVLMLRCALLVAGFVSIGCLQPINKHVFFVWGEKGGG